ncbi:MAG: endonuclease/exonuclease/phosphatase family protein [Bacteroidota bacterium]
MDKHLMLLAVFASLIFACSVPTTSVKKNQTPLREEAFKIGIVNPADYQNIVGDTIKILSWNVEHFIDAYDNPYTNNEREDWCDRMDGRQALLVEALQKADADIVVLQEFEHVQFLRQIAEDHLSDMNYRFFADNESPTWYMNVVVMSRVPLGIIYGYGSVTTPLTYISEETGEKVYETQNRINTRMWSIDVLVHDDYSFLLTGVHLKAGRGPRNEAMRLGQLQFLKGQFERFLRENPAKNILAVGDFNATPDSKEMQFMLKGGSRAQFIDNLNPSDFTHPADTPRWRIDHILPNDNMQTELIPGSIAVKYFFDTLTQYQLADHLPMVAEFITQDFIPKQ